MRYDYLLLIASLGWTTTAVAQQPPPPTMPPAPPATQAAPAAPVPGKPTQAKPKPVSQNCRDATSGKYVTPAYAKKNPTTTVCEAAPSKK